MLNQEVGVNKTIDNAVNYLQNNINKIKIGKITSVDQDKKTATIDLNIRLTKNDTTENMSPIDVRIFDEKNIEKQYKTGDLVLILFTDDNEDILIDNKQTKDIDYYDNTTKHALGNGIIIGVLNGEEEDNRISFVDKIEIKSKDEATIELTDKINVKSKDGSEIEASDKIDIKSSKGGQITIEDMLSIKSQMTDLKSVLEAILDNFQTGVQIVSPVGNCVVTATPWVQMCKMEIAKLLK